MNRPVLGIPFRLAAWWVTALGQMFLPHRTRPRCPTCGERTRDLGAHWDIEHCGDRPAIRTDIDHPSYREAR